WDLPPGNRIAAPATAAATGTTTTRARRQVNRRCRAGVGVPSAMRRTCSRSSAGAIGRLSRIRVRRSSRCDTEGLLELAERAVEARRAVGGRDPEHPGRRAGVEVEDDAEGDDLALAGRERAKRSLELGGQTLQETLVHALGGGGELLAPPPALL